MAKKIFFSTVFLILIWVLTFADFGTDLRKSNLNIPKANAAATAGVTLSVTILSYAAITTSTGATIAFGNLTPGTPICDPTGSAFSVITNGSNGYTLAVSDAIAGTNSPMVNTSSYIPDIAATVASPDLWTGGTTQGLGVGLYAATQKEAAWGAGTTVCDAVNKYAAIPQNATTGHTVTGYHAAADLSSWSWKIDVANTQKTGLYSGMVTFTEAPVLN